MGISKRVRTLKLPMCSYPKALFTAFSLEEPDLSVVKETPFMESSTATGSPWSFPKDEASSELASGPCSFTDGHGNSPKFPYLNKNTPQKNAAITTSSSILETESSLNQSVNSRCQKQRKAVYSQVVHPLEEECNAVDANGYDCTTFIENSVAYGRRIDFAVEPKLSKEKSKLTVPHLLTETNSVMSSSPAMDKRFYICCSLCSNALGLPENHQYAVCYLTTTSKTHVESLHRNILKPYHVTTSKDIPILVTDTSSVHQKIFNRTLECDSNRGIWCEKDGCVFNTIFCPFCSTRDNCLGVQVMATDASNLHLLNKVGSYFMHTYTKDAMHGCDVYFFSSLFSFILVFLFLQILFFTDQVKIKNPEASISEPLKDEVNLSYVVIHCFSFVKMGCQTPIMQCTTN